MASSRSLRGVGLGWRPETAYYIDRAEDLDFTEVLVENVPAVPPRPLRQLVERGVTVVPHGVSLSLGGAEPIAQHRLDRLARLAEALDAPLVSEHVAFVRAGGVESGHLLPIERTEEMLELMTGNIEQAQRTLPVPLVLENIAALVEWPGNEMSEAEFLSELVARTGVGLLLDLANLHAAVLNHGVDAGTYFDQLPLDRIVYCHVAGGIERRGLYHDTHAHPLPAGPLDLLRALSARRDPPPVLLERDRSFPGPDRIAAELAMIRAARRRRSDHAA